MDIVTRLASERNALLPFIVAGVEFVAPFRSDHAEIRALRDEVLTGADAS